MRHRFFLPFGCAGLVSLLSFAAFTPAPRGRLEDPLGPLAPPAEERPSPAGPLQDGGVGGVEPRKSPRLEIHRVEAGVAGASPRRIGRGGSEAGDGEDEEANPVQPPARRACSSAVNGRARVEVVDEHGGPARFAYVALRSVEGGVAYGAGASCRGLFRENVFETVEPGVYFAEVESGDGGIGVSEEARVSTGRETRFRVRVAKGVETVVLLRDAEGRPVATGAVAFVDARGRPRYGVWCGRDGGEGAAPAARALLPPGEYSLLVSASGYRISEQRVRLRGSSSTELHVRMERGAPVK